MENTHDLDSSMEVEITNLVLNIMRSFVKAKECNEEFIAYFEDAAMEYFDTFYQDPKDNQRIYQQFLEYAKKYGLTNR
ncbi:MAG: hypothetical protein Q8934_14240 [Bacillota bacterium]|nr:hypothetical protein [Bacillota bacterium]